MCSSSWRRSGLGDMVLFLGDDCGFSAQDLCVAIGNCVIYRNDLFRAMNDGMRDFH